MAACTRFGSRSVADPEVPADRRMTDRRLFVWLALLAALVALAVTAAVGVPPELYRLAAGPPAIVRAFLAGSAIVVGARLLVSAVRRIDSAVRRDAGEAGPISDAELGTLVRGVRLVFLAAAAFTAAAGWIFAEPLPLVIAVVIAAVDVVETSFLLLVATRRGS